VTPRVNRGLCNRDATYNAHDFVYVEVDNFPLRKDEETDLGEVAEKLKTFYVCINDSVLGNQNFPPISKNWQRDECSKKVSDCKLRFRSNLRFGGFPGCHEYPPKQ